SQKCMRAGGKHNDLENVGRTRRHHTFFEMLGNFSFGDYFKKEAIEYAWELVTKEYGLPVEKLYFTVLKNAAVGKTDTKPPHPKHIPKDEGAAEAWSNVGVPSHRIFYMGQKDNFWQMGESGPCGPCSEIHYDLGPQASDEGHADCAFPCDCGRYVEIWNLVFMEYNIDQKGYVTKLPKPSVDTGMGLERIAAVIQGKLSNFETDLLWPLVEEAEELAGVEYGEKHETDVSLRILADHSRAAAFLIHDGVLPSNEGRNYVLRLIIRRACYHGQRLDLNQPFLFKLAGRVAEMMKDAYPELLESSVHVAKVIRAEEERYARTTKVGLEQLDKAFVEITVEENKGAEMRFSDWRVLYSSHRGNVESLKRHVAQIKAPWAGPKALPPFLGWVTGEELFKLHDTFGLRPDFVEDIVRNYGLTVAYTAYDMEMQRQRERARASWKGVAKEVLSPVYAEVLKKGKTTFEGYQQITSRDCTVLALLRESNLVEELPTGAKAEVVLDHTPFYAEAGGQVGDAGVLLREDTQEVVATVEDTYSPVSGLIAHRILSRAPIRVGDRLTAVVDTEKREATKRNHTGTHLLHAALRQVLGTHVKQAGSVVEPNRLRFDFSHFASISEDELQEIERLANDAILRNTAVQTEILDLDVALETGAMAFFGEKYPDRVRVVSVPDFSKELCGGTHVTRTGDIGILKITHEGSISAGVRRVEAVTGEKALEQFQAVTSVVYELATALKTSPKELPAMLEKLTESQRQLEKQLESLKLKMAQAQLSDVESRVRSVKDIKVLSLQVDELDRGQMRSLADTLRQRLKSGVVVLATTTNGKVSLITALTSDLTKRLHAGKIAQAIAQRLGGTGGGRPDLAEAGGKNPALLGTVLNEVYEIIGSML
ncbi:MAG: alanine--tRNA ligase, partial [Acidobacteria bacterium]|nr:alanine--tRNA ligase [Acidobacteriota bacterium]